MVFFVVITGLCVWNCKKRGVQVIDMFLGFMLAVGFTVFVDLTPIGTALDGGFASAWHGIQQHI